MSACFLFLCELIDAIECALRHTLKFLASLLEEEKENIFRFMCDIIKTQGQCVSQPCLPVGVEVANFLQSSPAAAQFANAIIKKKAHVIQMYVYNVMVRCFFFFLTVLIYDFTVKDSSYRCFFNKKAKKAKMSININVWADPAE